jgi:hypothetical protein
MPLTLRPFLDSARRKLARAEADFLMTYLIDSNVLLKSGTPVDVDPSIHLMDQDQYLTFKMIADKDKRRLHLKEKSLKAKKSRKV